MFKDWLGIYDRMLFYDRNGRLQEVCYDKSLSERHFFSTLCLIKFGSGTTSDGTTPGDLHSIISRYRLRKQGTQRAQR